jgi:hypothetical protein
MSARSVSVNLLKPRSHTTVRNLKSPSFTAGRSEGVGSLFQVGDHAALAFSSVHVADLKKTPDPLAPVHAALAFSSVQVADLKKTPDPLATNQYVFESSHADAASSVSVSCVPNSSRREASRELGPRGLRLSAPRWAASSGAVQHGQLVAPTLPVPKNGDARRDSSPDRPS